MTSHAIFFSISDLELYKKLESLLPKEFPERTFAFLGDTFTDADWRPGEKSGLLPTSRLLWRWVHMNEFTERRVAPALQACDVVLVHNFGREAYHYAIRHMDCDVTLDFHKSLVADRLLGQKIKPPEYFATPPQDPRLRRADKMYFADRNQTMHYLESPHDDDHCHTVIRVLNLRLKDRRTELLSA